MKKSFILFLASFCFALPAFAQNAAQPSQTTQTVKTTATPAQVTVTINNTTSAQGNTQTTTVENSPQQTATATATATAASPKTVTDTASTGGNTSLFGNYASSPYQSNIHVEMLRNTVWGSLVPRKKLYDDPAKGNAPARYAGSKSKNTQKGSKKSETSQANSAQNVLANLSGQQIILVEQKDGQLCIPLDQFEPKKEEAKAEQKPAQNTKDTMGSSFYTPTTPSPTQSQNPAGAAVNPNNRTTPANNAAHTANGANGAGSVNPVNKGGTNPASPANPAQTANPGTAAAGANPASGNDIFAVPPTPSTPFNPVNPSNPAITGDALNPLGQAGQNPMARDPLTPQAPAGGAGGRNISVTPNNLGAPNS